MHIKGGENVGIVGKTGSGKSSIFAVLTRMIDFLHLGDGIIEIDGINIEDMSLKDLRTRIVTISQDPIVLNGSLQYNVDPLGLHTTQEVIEALQKVEIFQTIRFPPKAGHSSPEKGKEMHLLTAHAKEEHSVEEYLKFVVEPNGDNLSVGQKQLICIARALLKKAKILLLDEATANIDIRMDHLLQRLIKQEL